MRPEVQQWVLVDTSNAFRMENACPKVGYPYVPDSQDTIVEIFGK